MTSFTSMVFIDQQKLLYHVRNLHLSSLYFFYRFHFQCLSRIINTFAFDLFILFFRNFIYFLVHEEFIVGMEHNIEDQQEENFTGLESTMEVYDGIIREKRSTKIHIPNHFLYYFKLQTFLLYNLLLAELVNLNSEQIMNITRLNYSETLPFIKQVINESHFISLDFEMSGITASENTQPSLVDSVVIFQYSCNRGKFIPLQLGICGYKLDPESNKIVSYPFNFYIYPLAYSENRHSEQLFHLGSMKFLANNSFDFNKLFYEGIPYISNQEAEEAKKLKQEKMLKQELLKLNQLISPQMTAFVHLHFPAIRSFIQGEQQRLIIPIKYIKVKAYLYLLSQIQYQYPSASFTYTYDHQEIYRRTKLIITKRTEMLTTAPSIELTKPQQLIINQVINQISILRKPLIVHNGFLDLMHLYHRFYEQLPTTWSEYCQKLNRKFLYIYDTKYIVSTSPVLLSKVDRQTNLESLYIKLKQIAKTEQNWPTIEIHEDFKQYGNNKSQSQRTSQETSFLFNSNNERAKQTQKLKSTDGERQIFHQAGFDAFITGSCFFRSCGALKIPLSQVLNSNFHTKQSLLRNRIPLGNIKVPLNLQKVERDIYSDDGNQKYVFTSILRNERVKEAQLYDHFNINYGPIFIVWGIGNSKSFHISFVNVEHQNKFKLQNLDQNGIGLYKIEGNKYLVSPKQKDQIVLKDKAIKKDQIMQKDQQTNNNEGNISNEAKQGKTIEKTSNDNII